MTTLLFVSTLAIFTADVRQPWQCTELRNAIVEVAAARHDPVRIAECIPPKDDRG